jgi:hypothetical protein
LQVSPRTSYITLLDLQALLCYLLLSLAIGAVVLIAWQNKNGSSPLARLLNIGATIGYISLVILLNLALGWYGNGG